jgi:hypothetical protein
MKPTLKAHGTKRLTLRYDTLLSKLAFNLNLRRYTTAANGETRLRVTTTTRRWTDGANVNDIAAGFDQEAGAYTRSLFRSTSAVSYKITQPTPPNPPLTPP